MFRRVVRNTNMSLPFISVRKYVIINRFDVQKLSLIMKTEKFEVLKASFVIPMTSSAISPHQNSEIRRELGLQMYYFVNQMS